MSGLYPMEALFDAVVARFALEGPDAANRFGWRESARQKVDERRIVWIPGDPSGSIGVVGGAKKIDSPYRTLGTLREFFTVEIGAVDPSAPEDERAQYHATRLLFDYWYRAVYLAAPGTFSIESMEWETRRTERRRGALLRVVVAVDAIIPDQSPNPEDGICVLTSDKDGLRAEGEVELLTVKESLETSPAVPVVLEAPEVTGGTAEGDTLTCSTGAWYRDPTSYAFRWQRDGEDIPGATLATYVVGAIDEGSDLRCLVTASNAEGASLPAASNTVHVPEPEEGA